MIKQCVSCEYWEMNPYNTNTFRTNGHEVNAYCAKRRTYGLRSNDVCIYYDQGMLTEKDVEARQRTISRYYIITIITNLLGLPYYNSYIRAFAEMDYTFCQTTELRKAFMIDYDNCGPEIAKKILEDYGENPEATMNMILTYMMPILKSIKEKVDNKDYSKAFVEYVRFVQSLMNHYNVQINDSAVRIRK